VANKGKEANMESKIKLAIADANTLLREGLKRLLQDSEDFSVVGEAASDVETMNMVEQGKPEVLLLDSDIPKLEAVPILLTIKEQNLPTKVLILSLLSDESQILNTARAGARGYILKSTPFASLAEAIRAVSRGRIWVDRNAGFADIFALLAHRANTNNEIGVEINPLDVLTRREVEILHLIAKGASNEQIAKMLSIALQTAKTHVTNIFVKLNVKNRTQAALLLMQARSRNSQDYSPRLLRA
jgi:DNA-binding NarL/FixJ family response regulator